MISVIVPVFNSASYLHRCLESLVAQTFQDLEIILVNDGSTDTSLQICNEWAQKDNRVKVINKENGGAASSRNLGLSLSKGEFIGFVDSDDWIHPKMYELLYNAIRSHQADIIECDFQTVNEVCELSSDVDESLEITKLNPEEALEELIRERRIHQVPWNKLYRRNVIGNIKFPEGIICEDEFWTYQVISRATSIVCVKAILYFYYQSVDSVMRASYSQRRLVCIKAYEERLAFVTRYFPRLYKLANKSYLSACLFHSQMLWMNPWVDLDGSIRASLHTRFCSGDFGSLLAIANWKYKIWYRLFRYFPAFTCRIRNLCGIGL